jgi:hypothetical protein
MLASDAGSGWTCPDNGASRPEDHMSGISADSTTAVPTRRARVRVAAVARGVPLPTIIAAVAVVALAYLVGLVAAFGYPLVNGLTHLGG